MKKKLIIPISLLSFFLVTNFSEVDAIRSDKFVSSVRDLTNEKLFEYFTVNIIISDENNTVSPYNKIRNDYLTDDLKETTVIINKNDVLQTVYLISEDPKNEINKNKRLFKKLKINLITDEKVTLVPKFPVGVKENTWLKLDNKITIDGTNTSPMLTNLKDKNNTPFISFNNYKPYTSSSNIIIEGGIWDSNRDENNLTAEGFTFSNGSNILVKNVTIKDIAGGHAIDAAGVNNLVIENNNFLGSIPLKLNDRDYNEAIQLDQLGSSGPFSREGLSWGYFDGSVTKNVYIANNYFGKSNDSDSKPWQVAIGSHTLVKNKHYENITIHNNIFEGMTNSGIRMTNYKDVLISNNKFNNNEYSIKIYSSNYTYDTTNNKIDNKIIFPATNENITIKNNIFTNIKKWGIHINSVGYGGSSNSLTKNVYIENNNFSKANNSNLLYQNFAQNVSLKNLYHYDMKSYFLSESEAKNVTNILKNKGFDVSYKQVFLDQLYNIKTTKNFKSKSEANNAAKIIKEKTGLNTKVIYISNNKYSIETEQFIGLEKAKKMNKTIKELKYDNKYSKINNKNDLYRVGISTRYKTYNQAKKASEDFKKFTNASSTIIKEADGKYYVRTNNVLGKTRGENIAKTMKKKNYAAFSYNTNKLSYYEVNINNFFGKTYVLNQAKHIKKTYNSIETNPIYSIHK